jgi:hypothetical protein
MKFLEVVPRQAAWVGARRQMAAGGSVIYMNAQQD